MYEHPDILYTVDFLPGPVAIADETITTFHTARRNGEELRVLSATDVVRDRVLAYWAWNDFRALEVAKAIAHSRSANVQHAALEQWVRKLAESGVYDKDRLSVILPAIAGSQ